MPVARTGDIGIHYEERGAGLEKMLFVHGWTGTWQDWLPVLDRLPAGVHAVAVDLRGAGETDKPVDGYTIRQYSEDLAGFAGAIGFERFTFVGHSMGATIGYQFALDHGNLLRAAVLCAPTSADGYEGWSEADIEEIRKSRANRDLAVASARAYFLRPVAEEYVQRSADGLMAASDAHVFASIIAMRDLRLGPRLSEIAVPTLIVGADADTAIPLDSLVADFRRIPDGFLHVFQRSNHSMMVELPDAFSRTLFDFIHWASLGPGSGQGE